MRHRVWSVVALTLALLGLAATADAQSSVYVRPHYRSNGSYVEGHYRTAPDSSRLNNWSTEGNTNPYTGKQGTVDPYSYGSSSGSSLYQSTPSPSSRSRCSYPYLGC